MSMSDIEKSLMPNETIIVSTELHWIIFFWPLILTLFLITFMFKQHYMFLLNYAALALIVYFLGSVFIQYVTTYYVLTTKRVIIKRGLLFVKSWDITIPRIESVQLQQSFIGKMFDYGDLVINGIGGDSIVFLTMEDPLTFRKELFGLMEKPNS